MGQITCGYAEFCVFSTNHLDMNEVGACMLASPLAHQIGYTGDANVKGELSPANLQDILANHQEIIGNCPNLEIQKLLKFLKQILELMAQLGST